MGALPRLPKFLAWFAIINGISSIAMPGVVPYLTGQLVSASGIALLVVLGVASLVSGVYGLRAQPWAFLLLLVTFFVQVAEYRSESLFLSLIGPISLKFGWGWNSPPSWFNINVLAIVICVLAARAIYQLTPDPEVRDA